MKLKTNTLIPIKECIKRKDRFKTFKFYLDKIDYGLYIPNKRLANTYLFCQNIDICFVNKDNIIVALYENIKSEKLKYQSNAKDLYFLPLGTCTKLKKGNKIPIIK